MSARTWSCSAWVLLLALGACSGGDPPAAAGTGGTPGLLDGGQMASGGTGADPGGALGGNPGEPDPDAGAGGAGGSPGDTDAAGGQSGQGGGIGPDAAPSDGPPEPTPIGPGTCTPAGARQLFVDAIAETAWLNVELGPEGGMRALADELARLASQDRDRPVRVRLKPGDYAPTDLGRGEIYLEDVQRSASAPVLVQAIDPTPNATRLSQGFTLVGVSFLAFDGLTIGPATVGAWHGSDFCSGSNCYHDAPKPLAAEAGFHVAGTALAPEAAGLKNGHLDFTVYGRYAPSHDIVIRRATIQNLFADDEESGATAAGGGSDGIKFNQAADVWVIDSRIRQTSRHGIDNVGVHRGCFLGNTVTDIGVGLGIEAKGGSIDVTFDGNTFINVRRMEVGGEKTDATFYWSAEEPGTPLHYAYEGRRIVARNNLIIDPREGGIEFSGCHDCAAVNNTLFYRRDFASEGGGDAVREVDSQINTDGAGASCAELNGEEIEPCWGVGPYPADLVQLPGENGQSRVFTNARNTLGNNLFLNASGGWGLDRAPYNHPNPDHSFGFAKVDHNHWWNAMNPLMDPGDDTWLREGPQSVFAGSGDAAAAIVNVAFIADPARLDAGALARAALRPAPASAVVGKGTSTLSGYAAHDAAGTARPAAPSVGALEP